MAGSLQLVKKVTGSDVNTLSITNCFSDKYDIYKVVGHTAEYRPTDTNVIDLRIQFIDSGGSVISGSEYDTARLTMKAESSFDNDRQTSATYMYGTMLFGNYDNAGMVNYIYNPNNSSSFTFMIGQGAGGYDTSNNRFRGAKQISVHKSAEQISGIHFISSSGSLNFDVTISVYGVK
tara:strand:- start:55 stop:585 length:531 start_codon:yes stop_codon:yes gene_type:complete